MVDTLQSHLNTVDPSHVIMDISDVSNTADLMCQNCHATDASSEMGLYRECPMAEPAAANDGDGEQPVDHVLKSWSHFFQGIVSGQKKHDVRDMRDRVFKIGDICLLREFDPFGGGYTGREQRVKITFITSRDTPCAFSSAVLDRDYAILSLELMS